MPTGTPEQHPFTPHAPPSRDELLAYARGEMPNHERHGIERALEADPLLREALEGLSVPGAMEGLASLGSLRPDGIGPVQGGAWWVAGTIVIMAMLAGSWIYIERHRPEPRTVSHVSARHILSEDAGDPMGARSPLERSEIEVAVEQPESLLIGHGIDELHARVATVDRMIEREPAIDVLDPRPTDPDPLRTEASKRPARTAKSSRQLLYVFDLKLVHPKEMYGPDPLKPVLEDHVTARHADKSAQERALEPQRLSEYVPYFTEALRKFKRNDHKGCLEDLRFLLAQYPKDVNALFYAGLCSYNLGMYSRAREFLGRSAHHPIDTFDEESEWYLALTLDRSGEHEEAVEAYNKIIAERGFYAERARERMMRE